MTFLAHTALGAGLSASVARAYGAPAWLRTTLGICGGILGALPDVGDWLVATLGFLPRWQLYNEMHLNSPWWLLIWPPYTLHVGLDTIVHTYGPNWWPAYWWLEILLWVVAGLLFYHAYRKQPL